MKTDSTDEAFLWELSLNICSSFVLLPSRNFYKIMLYEKNSNRKQKCPVIIRSAYVLSFLVALKSCWLSFFNLS